MYQTIYKCDECFNDFKIVHKNKYDYKYKFFMKQICLHCLKETNFTKTDKTRWIK